MPNSETPVTVNAGSGVSSFLIVNPKAYIYGQESLELALVCDQLSEEYDIDIIYTAQHVDLRMISKAVKHLILTAQHMDGLVPGRGMGHILPEGIRDAGAQAVILEGAHGSGGTSGILNAPSRKGKIIEMLEALKRVRQELKDKKLS